MNRAIVPVATMLAIQVMISLSVLSLSVMMPAVAADLAIDPKLVGIFTAIIYAVAAVMALAAAEPIVRLGAVRICQAALLMAAIGLAFNALAMVAATVIAVLFIGAAQGPINPGVGACPGPARAARMVRHGVLAEADRRAHRLCPGRADLSRCCCSFVGWRGASLIAAGAAVVAALVVELLRASLDVVGHRRQAVGRHLALHPLRVRPSRSCACSGWSAFVYVIAQHTFTFYLVTYLYEHCGLSIARAGFLLSASQLVGTAVRLLSGGMGDRMPRMQLLGWTGIGMTAGCIAIGLLEADTPFWLIALVVSATARSSSAGTARRRPSSPTSRRPAKPPPSPRFRPPSPSPARSSGRRSSP